MKPLFNTVHLLKKQKQTKNYVYVLEQQTRNPRKGRESYFKLRWWWGDKWSCSQVKAWVCKGSPWRDKLFNRWSDHSWPPNWLPRSQTVHNIDPTLCLPAAVKSFFRSSFPAQTNPINVLSLFCADIMWEQEAKLPSSEDLQDHRGLKESLVHIKKIYI